MLVLCSLSAYLEMSLFVLVNKHMVHLPLTGNELSSLCKNVLVVMLWVRFFLRHEAALHLAVLLKWRCVFV